MITIWFEGIRIINLIISEIAERKYFLKIYYGDAIANFEQRWLTIVDLCSKLNDALVSVCKFYRMNVSGRRNNRYNDALLETT